MLLPKVGSAYGAVEIVPNTVVAKSRNVSTWTDVHHSQVARMSWNSKYTRRRTAIKPTPHHPIRPNRTSFLCDRHARGNCSGNITRKNASPSTATGIPHCIDQGLVVTFRQLMMLGPLVGPVGHASVVDPV